MSLPKQLLWNSYYYDIDCWAAVSVINVFRVGSLRAEGVSRWQEQSGTDHRRVPRVSFMLGRIQEDT